MLIELQNTSHHELNFSIASTRYKVLPKGIIHVDHGYCVPRPTPNGGQVPSIIKGIAPQLEVVGDVPIKLIPGIHLPTAPDPEMYVEQGYAPGVAELLAKKEKAERDTKTKGAKE